VLLVEKQGRLGGMMVNALVGPLMGNVRSKTVDDILTHIGGRTPDPHDLDVRLASLLEQNRADYLLHAQVVGVLKNGSRVTGLRCYSRGGHFEIPAGVIVDATGDGEAAYLAGATFEQGRPGDGLMQPVSIMYRIGGVDPARALLCACEEDAEVREVPEGKWADVVRRGQESGELPWSVGVIRIYETPVPGERIVNATQVNGVDATDPLQLTRAEIEGRRQAYRILAFLRAHAPGYENASIAAMPAVVGVRESRRFLGLEYLTRDDLLEGRQRDDAVVKQAEFVIDIHNPEGAGQAEGSARNVKPYDIPYGCLVPKEVGGLLLAGRCISGSHDAHASYRVCCIAMAIGAAAGAAAALASGESIPPRGVDPREVRALLEL